MSHKYTALSNIIKQKLKEVLYYALTTDIWTDTHKTVSYLGLTVHFIDKQEYKSITIGVKHLQENHTADHIENWLNEMILKWYIVKDKVVVVVADQAANIKRAVKDCFGEDKYLACLAHTVNLVVSLVLEKDLNVAGIISNNKDIVAYFHRSCVASDQLRTLTDLVLLQCVITHWNSVYIMLDRYLEIHEYVATILLRLAGSNVPRPLIGEEIKIARELMVLLKPFKQITDVLSGEKYLTGSEAIPLVKNLNVRLQKSPPQLKPAMTLKNCCKNSLTEDSKILQVCT